jgi:hypothetical protein
LFRPLGAPGLRGAAAAPAFPPAELAAAALLLRIAGAPARAAAAAVAVVFRASAAAIPAGQRDGRLRPDLLLALIVASRWNQIALLP